MTARFRYVPEMELLSYAYVPGHRPHPNRDPAGHGQSPEPEDIPDVTDLRHWQENRIYLAGIDLFNLGKLSPFCAMGLCGSVEMGKMWMLNPITTILIPTNFLRFHVTL